MGWFCAKRQSENFKDELTDIKSKLKAYHSTYRQMRKIDPGQSTRIQVKLCRLLNEAYKVLATGDYLHIKKEILCLFSESIVCEEDEVLFRSSTNYLVTKGVLSEEESKFVIEHSSWHCQHGHRIQ